jgi:hypothetical protein
MGKGAAASLSLLHTQRQRLSQYHGQENKDAPPESQYLALELEYPVFRRLPVWQCVLPPRFSSVTPKETP